jgi:hypothetical protein
MAWKLRFIHESNSTWYYSITRNDTCRSMVGRLVTNVVFICNHVAIIILLTNAQLGTRIHLFFIVDEDNLHSSLEGQFAFVFRIYIDIL